MSEELKDYEQNIARLGEIVQQLEKGDLSLQQALNQYEQGIALVAKAKEQLEFVEQKIMQLQGDQLVSFNSNGQKQDAYASDDFDDDSPF